MDRRTSGLVIAVLAIVFLMPRTAPTSAQGTNTVEALLVEVRGLRAALEQLASAGPRVQLLFGRLQLQEQRVHGLRGRLEALREKIQPAQGQADTVHTRVARFENFLRTSAPTHPEREEIEQQMPSLRKELAQAVSEVQRLQQEEAAVAAEMALEQGRWTDINQRLEELEKALARR